MIRISENPPSRYPENRALGDDCGTWWVARVKPRNEKALAWDLYRMGLSYYLPLVTKRSVRRDNGKPRKSIICLFPGYLCIAGSPEIKPCVFRTGRVFKMIEVIDQTRFITEMESVRKACEHAIEVTLHPRLAAGQRVIIAHGPMQGVEGVITELDGPDKVYLNVDMFQRAVKVSMLPEQVRPVDRSWELKIASA